LCISWIVSFILSFLSLFATKVMQVHMVPSLCVSKTRCLLDIQMPLHRNVAGVAFPGCRGFIGYLGNRQPTAPLAWSIIRDEATTTHTQSLLIPCNSYVTGCVPKCYLLSKMPVLLPCAYIS
jgi:hypothetical protein